MCDLMLSNFTSLIGKRLCTLREVVLRRVLGQVSLPIRSTQFSYVVSRDMVTCDCDADVARLLISPQNVIFAAAWIVCFNVSS